MDARQLGLFDDATDAELKKPVVRNQITGEREIQEKRIERMRSNPFTEEERENVDVIDFLRGMPFLGRDIAADYFVENPCFLNRFRYGRNYNLLRDELVPDDEFRILQQSYRDRNIMPGTLQLFHTLYVRDARFRNRDILDLEYTCEGEPLIGMELYPDAQAPAEHMTAAAGAGMLNGFRRGCEFDICYSKPRLLLDIITGRTKLQLIAIDLGAPSCHSDTENLILSSHDGTKWNYRPMPTYHPIFAMLMRELSPYIPHKKPVPYMLCVGDNMGSDSALLLSAWLLSYPEISMLSNAMKATKGELDFPGIYLGQRIMKRSKNKVKLDKPMTQTNLYAGIMHEELPPPAEFIRMAGVLAKARKEKTYFDGFKDAFYDTLTEAGLKDNIVPLVTENDLNSTRGGKSFPELERAAVSLPEDVSGYIRGRVQGHLRRLEQALYSKEHLDIIERAYAGQLVR